MQVTTATRLIGFDTSVYVNPKYHKLLRNAGYSFAVRYIWRTKAVNSTPNSGWPCALSKQELTELLDSGFGVSIVQFANNSSFIPTKSDGTSVGEAAAYNALGLGIPVGATLWCDAEWSSTTPDSKAVLDYLNAWAEPVIAVGYEAGLYVGPNQGLTGDQLYGCLNKFNHYWKCASIVPWVSNRGFQMFQGAQTTLFKTDSDQGLLVDQDIVCYDNKNERFKLVIK